MTEPSESDAPDSWTDVEKGMWRAFRHGDRYDLRSGVPADDDPVGARTWGPERTVRAEAVATLLLDGPPAASGRVACLKLAGVRISGRLNLSGGDVAPYVELHHCRFQQEVLLPEARFTTLRLMHCVIPRLEAARLSTAGDLHMPRCTVPGGIRLTDAHIGTDLLLNQLTVRQGRNSRAIAADGLTVGQDVEAELIDARGEISLRSARIGGRLSLRGSVLRNPRGRFALNAVRLTVEHTLYLSSGWLDPGGRVDPGGTSGAPPAGVSSRPFRCEGGVRLDDGRFGNAVIITRAHIHLARDQRLSLRRIQTPELRLDLVAPPAGPISLAGARVGNLADTRQSWPGPGLVELTGFSYEALTPASAFPLHERIAWLASATPEYSPQPYEHLAAALRAGGEDSQAREVLLAKQRRRHETLPPAARVWGFLQDITVGYGYRPGRAALWMAVLWALGATYFALHPPQALKADEAPHWNAALYALDLLLPVIDLGQDSAWKPAGGPQWVAAVLVLLGWILATTVAAGATRLLRRG